MSNILWNYNNSSLVSNRSGRRDKGLEKHDKNADKDMASRTLGNQAMLNMARYNEPIQTKLKLGQPDDKHEREADRVAEQVMRMPGEHTEKLDSMPSISPTVQRKTSSEEEIPQGKSTGQVPRITQYLASGIQSIRGGGQPLPKSSRNFFESRFGRDFSHVRTHSDNRTANLAKSINARAFTVGNDVVFGAGEFSPNTGRGRHLLAHELTHVAQNEKHTQPTIRRDIQLRPPGRGEASAFDRGQELVDRLSATSAAVTYRLNADGRTLEFDIDDEAAKDDFDRKMTGFIGEAQVIPLRLITGAGRVRGAAGNFVPLTADSFVSGYVDLDDLLGSSDIGFKLLLAHFITERLQVPNYARRIGTAGLVPLFNRAHNRGRDAEAEVLADLLNDPSIRHQYDELKPNGTTFVRAFISDDEGYRVFWVIRGHGRRAAISITDIRVNDDGRRVSIEDFIAERAAAVP